MEYDLTIIGGSSAGLTAAIYAGRKKINTILLAKQIGGQALLTDNIENFPGFEIITGKELTEKIYNQVKKYDVKINEGVEVESIEKEGDKLFSIKLKTGETIKSKSIIIATGKKPGHLNVPGEKEFKNKGVVFCATCDAPLFGGKDVVVVGAGNSSLESAIDLLKYANKIYVLTHGEKIRGDAILYEKLEQSEKVEFILNAEVQEIKGNDFVEKIIYKDKKAGETKELNVGGIFINVGWTPASSFLGEAVDLNEKGEVIINPKTNETSVPGIFAAGDISDVKYKQFIVAAGEGAKAALSAFNYLSH